MSMKLVRLWQRAQEVRAKRRAIPDAACGDEVSSALCGKECGLYEDMLDEPATDLRGVLQKLRAAATFYEPDELERDLPMRLFASALGDAERLAGEEGGGRGAR